MCASRSYCDNDEIPKLFHECWLGGLSSVRMCVCVWFQFHLWIMRAERIHVVARHLFTSARNVYNSFGGSVTFWIESKALSPTTAVRRALKQQTSTFRFQPDFQAISWSRFLFHFSFFKVLNHIIEQEINSHNGFQFPDPPPSSPLRRVVLQCAHLISHRVHVSAGCIQCTSDWVFFLFIFAHGFGYDF